MALRERSVASSPSGIEGRKAQACSIRSEPFETSTIGLSQSQCQWKTGLPDSSCHDLRNAGGIT
eukprot:767992-Hanusia_phi.AAC.7